MRHSILLTALPLFLALDLLLPFLLAPACPGYRHTMQVMSVLGSERAPLHLAYNLWLIVLGAVVLAGALRLRPMLTEVSGGLAWGLTAVLAVYAVGGCILSGCFLVGETKELTTLSAGIHGFGSAIGFLALAFAPLLAGLLLLRAGRGVPGAACLLCFVLAAGFFTLFILADKPAFQGTAVAREGLWQRLSLLCMYLPVGALSLFYP